MLFVKVHLSKQTSIGNVLFLGDEDSTWIPYRNDITVILITLIRYLGLKNKAFCFFPLLMKTLFDIVTIPAFPFDATISKAIALLLSTDLSTNEQLEIVTLDFPPRVFKIKGPITDVCLFL